MLIAAGQIIVLESIKISTQTTHLILAGKETQKALILHL